MLYYHWLVWNTRWISEYVTQYVTAKAKKGRQFLYVRVSIWVKQNPRISSSLASCILEVTPHNDSDARQVTV